MLIRLGYDIELEISRPMAVITVLNVHPSRTADMIEPDQLRLSPSISKDDYLDSFGNCCSRILAPQGDLHLWSSTVHTVNSKLFGVGG
jgi:hypothetical protein